MALSRILSSKSTPPRDESTTMPLLSTSPSRNLGSRSTRGQKILFESRILIMICSITLSLVILFKFVVVPRKSISNTDDELDSRVNSISIAIEHESRIFRENEIFSEYPLSTRSFEDVRMSYTKADEIERPLELVYVPDNFRSVYNPQTMDDLYALADRLIAPAFGHNFQRNANIAIVTVCIEMDICELTGRNHKIYSEKHGYDVLRLTDAVVGVQPKMVKFLVLAFAMKQGYDWALMLDADTLITDMDMSLENFIGIVKPTNETSLIVTRGGDFRQIHIINNGVFLLRNTAWSEKHLYDIWTSRFVFTRFLGRTLVDQPLQASLLLASKELSWPPVDVEEVGNHVTVTSLGLNGFRRNLLQFPDDANDDRAWKPGDFIAHFVSDRKYSSIIDLIKQEHLPGLIPVKERCALHSINSILPLILYFHPFPCA